jgi:predicted ArsR family transcriptional regulator
MLAKFGRTQRKLLKLFLKEKEGLTAEATAQRLRVTRTAVVQHLNALKKLGYIEKGDRQLTGGRPSQSFKISPKGLELFPRQYSWFSELMIESIRAERGSEGLIAWFQNLARSVAHGFQAELSPLSKTEKIKAIAKIMSTLHYDAVATSNQSSLPGIEASNCVFHALAQKFPEVCEFDLTLLQQLSGGEVQHQSCMLRGSNLCRFHFSEQQPRKKSAKGEQP